MKHLKILSLGRNQIKSIAGIVSLDTFNSSFIINDHTFQEAVADTLEELWISYNQIDKLKGIGVMKKLRILLMSNNHVREWCEFMRLSELQSLKELVFLGNHLVCVKWMLAFAWEMFECNWNLGNPLEERCTSEGIWRPEVARRLPSLAKLDGQQCTEAEVNLADTQTELQKTEADDDDNQGSKFNVTEDNQDDDEEKDDEDEDNGNEDDDEDETEDDEDEAKDKSPESETKEEVNVNQDGGQETAAVQEESADEKQSLTETIAEEVPQAEE